MKFSTTFVILCCMASSVTAFTTLVPAAKKASSSVVSLKMVEVAEPPSKSGMKMKDVRKAIAKLDANNFESTLKSIEPFLVSEAGATMYDNSMRRTKSRAKALGVQVPVGYAAQAKATKKKREKQNAFIQKKEEARIAAEEASAAAAAAAAEAAAAAAAEAATSAEGEKVPVEV
jgi:phosphoribosylformylglycinamidine (FGAM) synthase-like enzyme